MTYEERAREVLGGTGCTCHEAYTGRKLIDPSCIWCDLGADVTATLREARVEGARKGIEAAASVLDRDAREWTRRNVEIAKTDYAKGKTYRLARSCEYEARQIRALDPAEVVR